MKTFSLLLTALLLVNFAFQQPPDDLPELKEAAALTESVVKLFNEQKFDEALPLAKRALQIREKLLPGNDLRLATSLSFLGDLYIVKRDYGAATPILQRVLKIREEQFGPDDPRLLTTLDRLAALYRSRRDFDRAVPTYTRALLMYGRLSGVNTPDFERTSDAFTCLAYETKNLSLVKDLNEIRKQFAPAKDPAELVERGILNGRALALGRPEYPAGARQRGLSGTVVVKVEIDEAGKVISAVDMCQGPPFLSESAVKAAWKSQFTPTKIAGRPIKVKGVIQYNFVRM